MLMLLDMLMCIPVMCTNSVPYNVNLVLILIGRISSFKVWILQLYAKSRFEISKSYITK